MNDTMILPVPLTVDEITVRAKELAKTLEEKANAEYSMKSYAASCKSKIAEADEKIRELYQTVNSGREYRAVDVTEKPNYARGIMEIFRLDTGEVVQYRELKESEKTRSLFPEHEAASAPEEAVPDSAFAAANARGMEASVQ